MAGLTDVQERLLEMLTYFHEFCENNHIRYYIVGGTALGAIRHHGFIPWDDDIDIGLPRKDYNRLVDMFPKISSDKYVIETLASGDIGFIYPYAKLYDTTTTLIENTKHKLVRGLYIDIFPLDGIGNTEENAKVNFKRIDKCKKLLALRTIKVDRQRSRLKNMLLRIAQSLPQVIINDNGIARKIDDLASTMDFDTSKYAGNLVGAWGWKEVMPREFFGTPHLYKFESIEVYGPECYDEYLTHLYHDWRKLPPKEKQVSHHDHYLDLDTSYIKKGDQL